jgi:general secretion pathway protein D
MLIFAGTGIDFSFFYIKILAYMKKRLFFVFIFFNLAALALTAQKIKSMEFHDQQITDILLVLAQTSGTSIIPDETVTGTASFYFSDSDLEDALSLFLSTYKMYYTKEGSVIKVSRIKSSYDAAGGLVSLTADSVPVESLLRSLSHAIGKTVLYDTLPAISISVDINALPVKDVLGICIKRLPDYTIETGDSYFYIKKEQKETAAAAKEKKENGIKRNGDIYSLSLDRGRFLDTLTSLFSAAGKEYSLFVQSDIQLENMYFAGKDFDTMLRLILEHGNADYIEQNGIYYIIDMQKKGIGSKLKSTDIVQLSWIQAQDIPSLLPADLTAGSVLRIDKNTNSVLLTGTPEEIQPIEKFIRQVDVPLNGLQYKRIDIKYLDVKSVIPLIPSKMIQTQPVQIPGTNSLLASGTKETLDGLATFIADIDIKKAGVPIHLKYIQAADVLKNLPPSLTKDMIVDSGYPNLLFYTGTDENCKLFMHELNLIDRPKPQIRYQLLVIQYTKGKSSSFKPSATIKQSSESPNFVFSGDLSNIMTLTFDVIAKFGYEFAATLNAQISDNTANVFTDTTLTGLSGQDIKFQNTDTYRYIEYEVDESSSTTTRTGVTQQITSGLIVSLNGWVSGDDMITMTVNATVSKQNSDTSSSSSSTSVTTLPSTSERVVNTQVRTPSGEPVVISGLIKDDTSVTVQRLPVLGYIPLLGYLFRQTSKSKDKTEIVIYIVPHLIQETKESGNDDLRLERYYKSFVAVK